MHRSKRAYSITASARARNASEIVMPRALAVFRLTTSSNFRRLHDRQVAGLLALENAAHVNAGLFGYATTTYWLSYG